MDTLRREHRRFRDEKAEADDGDGDHGKQARIGHGLQWNSSVLNELFWHARTRAARRRQSMIIHLAASVLLIEKLHRGDAHHGCRRYHGAPWMFAYFIACACSQLTAGFMSANAPRGFAF